MGICCLPLSSPTRRAASPRITGICWSLLLGGEILVLVHGDGEIGEPCTGFWAFRCHSQAADLGMRCPCFFQPTREARAEKAKGFLSQG